MVTLVKFGGSTTGARGYWAATVIILLLFSLSGCDDFGNAEPISTEQTIEAESHLGGVFPGVTVIAELSTGESGLVVVNSDGLEIITFSKFFGIEGVLTRHYYLGDILLGSVTDYFRVTNWGVAIKIPRNPELFESNYDEDSDGWTNVAELRWGSDIEDPFSIPPSYDSSYEVTSGGGKSASAQYEMMDRVGRVMAYEQSSSSSYRVTPN